MNFWSFSSIAREKRVYSRIEEICALLAGIAYGENETRHITADFGISYTEDFEKTKNFLNDMINQADERMYRNKKKKGCEKENTVKY